MSKLRDLNFLITHSFHFKEVVVENSTSSNMIEAEYRTTKNSG